MINHGIAQQDLKIIFDILHDPKIFIFLDLESREHTANIRIWIFA